LKNAIIIPARLQSSRLPRKVLLDICGKSLIQRVYEKVQESQKAQRIIVATDSNEVAKVVEDFGGEVFMTSDKHKSGTDRVAEVTQNLDVDFVVNVQGDEPLISPDLIDKIVDMFENDKNVLFGTAKHKISEEEANDSHIVKVVTDVEENGIYFSRSRIPFHRDGGDEYFQHIGIYGYKKEFLEIFTKLPHGKLEEMEKLEQLRAIENGFKIRVVETEYKSIGVDTESDLEKVKRIICG
jgi:3-deoxy-manno-octulosonate cytidylyltransferase (CMP-KDO synthetase)